MTKKDEIRIAEALEKVEKILAADWSGFEDVSKLIRWMRRPEVWLWLNGSIGAYIEVLEQQCQERNAAYEAEYYATVDEDEIVPEYVLGMGAKVRDLESALTKARRNAERFGRLTR